MERAEPYEANTAPAGVLALTCGVDVQDNRLAVSVWGWGVGEESWLVHHSEVWGDPTAGEVWKQLDAILGAEYRREDGASLRVLLTCVDSGGHCTGEVYQFARERRAQGVMAIKGASQRGKPPVGRETKVDLTVRGRTLKRGASVVLVGTDTIKDTIYGRLRHNDEPGPGCVHFGKAATPEYFEQLTAERKVTRYTRNGMPVSEYTKRSNARNEALDTAVYAMAALHLLYRRFDRRTIWEQMAARLAKGEGVKLEPKRKPAQSPRPGGFVSAW